MSREQREHRNAKRKQETTREPAWHQRSRHPGPDETKQIHQHYLGRDEEKEPESPECSACSQGRQTRARMRPSQSDRATAPLELVHIDPITDYRGHANYHYALIAVDHFSSRLYAGPLCTKSAAFPARNKCIVKMERATARKLKTLRSDNGREWNRQQALDWQTQGGFKWQKTTPAVSAQNGRAESTIRSVQRRCGQCLLAELVEGSSGLLQLQLLHT